MMRALSSIRADQRGNSLIEMAIVAPVLATLLVGAVDISRGVSNKLRLEQAAQRTIELVQRSEYKTTDNPTLKADAEAAAGTGSVATVTAWLECNHNGTKLNYDTGVCATQTEPYARYVQVTVQKTFKPMFGTRFFPGANPNGTFTLRAIAGVRTQ